MHWHASDTGLTLLLQGAGKGKRIAAAAGPLVSDQLLDAANSATEGPGLGQGVMGLPVSTPGIKAEPVDLKPQRSRQRSPLTAGGLQPVPTLVKEEWGQVCSRIVMTCIALPCVMHRLLCAMLHCTLP